MENINITLFLWLNAPEYPTPLLLAGATFLAEYLIWAVPALLILGWLYGTEPLRKAMLMAATAGLAGLLANQLIGLLWTHPRPFMAGLGHTLINHAPDSSFPSDHLTLWWSIACSLVLHRPLRLAGAALCLLGLPMAWARIYLGVHFPLDMLGALCVALQCAWLARTCAPLYMTAVYGTFMRAYRLMLSKLIAQGWVAD